VSTSGRQGNIGINDLKDGTKTWPVSEWIPARFATSNVLTGVGHLDDRMEMLAAHGTANELIAKAISSQRNVCGPI